MYESSFSNQVFIIMGGTTGIGFAATQALHTKGARLVVVGLDAESCENIRQLYNTEKVVVLQGDACDSQTINSAIKTADEKFGNINGLLHIAGGSGRKYGDGPLDQITDEGWQYTLNLNLTSVMLSNRAMVKYFIQKKIPGTILNTGSVLAISPSPKYFATHAYAAAKSALIGFSKSVASYYAAENIRVNIISPGLFETPMARRAVNDGNIKSYLQTKQPLDGGRPGKPDDLINAVLLFLSPGSKFITGQVLAVDGGWMISDGQIS
ncbi:MAG: SDR family NAD(P)-dependent oxidoreductase [Prolixibacteraceae bacterium]